MKSQLRTKEDPTGFQWAFSEVVVARDGLEPPTRHYFGRYSSFTGDVPAASLVT
jgi:hypothetical protein